MKKASIRELHIHTSALVRKTAAGAVILIERRGEPVAELRPISKECESKLPDISDLWRRLPADSGRFLEEDR